jgi:hypothetical protein
LAGWIANAHGGKGITLPYARTVAEREGEKSGCVLCEGIPTKDELMKGNVLNYVQEVLEIGKGHGKKVGADQNTDLHPLGGNHDPC